MKKELNLLLEKQHIKKEMRKSFLVAVTLFVAIFIPSIIIVIYNISLNNQLKNLTDNQVDITNKLASQSEKIAKIIRLNDRLEKINNALKTRNGLDTKIDSILYFIPEDVFVKDFAFESTSNLLSISLLSTNLYDLNSILEKIDSVKSIKEIQKVEIDLLQFDVKASNYVLKLNYYFPSQDVIPAIQE